MLRSTLFALFIVGCLGSVIKEGRVPLPDSRIVGGTTADIHQHPYQLSLQTSGHICGASIISNRWAITAGHCVGLPANRYTLRAGNNNKNQGDLYRVKNVIRHPNYNARTVDFDVALLEIDGTFRFTNTVKAVTLASSEPAVGKMVDITGWGALREGGNTSPQLMKVSIPIVSRDQCQKLYGKMNTITARMICAGYTAGGKDSCQGDSGGPMTSNGVQYGIVSWGNGCAKPQYPGVYSNVANLRSWIRSISGV